MKIKFILFPLFFVLLSGCLSTVPQVDSFITVKKKASSLTEEEVARGLKEALERGASTAVDILSRQDGYYGDPLVRLSLPREAAPVVDNIEKLPRGKALLDDLILRINRSAEEAAKEALPIFAGAIREMTLQEAFNILKGKEDAATAYFKARTYDSLRSLYQPELNRALDRDIAGGLSANEAWYTLMDLYNELAGSVVGKVQGLKKVNIDLSVYLTEKALDGLFLKIADEEKEIRKNPAKRVSALLKKVFGSLD